MQAFSAKMCSQGDGAGPLLVEAIGAGGERAKVAVASLLLRSCDSDDASNAAFDALINSPELSNTTEAVRYDSVCKINIHGQRAGRRGCSLP